MLALRQPVAPMIANSPDRFRGTIQRWTIEAGPLCGRTADYAFNDDWSVAWRIVTGPEQGRVGRAREFAVQPVRSQLFLVSFAFAAGEMVTATVDFASRRFVGFHAHVGECNPMSGSLRVL